MSKAALKAAKQAIDDQKWDQAVTHAREVIAIDSDNYFANLFLGRAYEKLGQVQDAAKAYHSAANLKPQDTQAWLGLCSLYEAQGASKVDEYGECAVKVAMIYADANDAHRCQSAIDKLTVFAKKNGTPVQYKRALQVTLPGSPVYDFLEGRLPHPALTYVRLAEMTEKDEKQSINKEIGERRTRLGARLGQVTEEVKRQAYAKSELETLYRSVIDWTLDDEVRSAYEEKLLQRAYDCLSVLPHGQKSDKRQQVADLSRGMVIVKRQVQLAWDIHLEWLDVSTLASIDVNILYEYIEFFPAAALSKTLRAFLDSEVSPYPARDKAKDEEQEEQIAPLSQQDRLILMSESLGDGQGSPLAHRIVGEYYSFLDEHESAIQTIRNGLSLLDAQEEKSGQLMPANRDAMTSVLATALVYHQAPRHHVEAQKLFDDILTRNPMSSPALIGLGLIHEEQGNHPEAIKSLDKALAQDPNDLRIATETAWCRALQGDHQTAVDMLNKYLPDITVDTPKSRDLRAQTLYRIGRCMWELDDSKSARKDRSASYARFLSAIKTNVNFAPAYTSLGFYYADYAKDKRRARQCFQKAFELAASEVEAAERLARTFAEKSEWDIVEAIAQRVIDSGRLRTSPGSKQTRISWPYSALGVVQMTKLEYSKAVTSFLSALKINPEDYNSYVGLGESYHNSGRYNSASRTFLHAESLQVENGRKEGEKWFTEYMLANVHRELGEYDDAFELLSHVLIDRPSEFGVLIALLQTRVEHAWRCVETGLLSQAADNAALALDLSQQIATQRPDSFNLWRAIGDACSIFLWVQSHVHKADAAAVRKIITSDLGDSKLDMIADIDGIDSTQTDSTQNAGITMVAQLAVLAHKRALAACEQDQHAQAVAWYNLGWAEYRASTICTAKAGKKYLKAAVRCFKRAIELEAGNSEFWNSLGVVTSSMNPRVAQHAFVRSLHLYEHSARTWTNLAVLYLENDDLELAHEAFARAQSTDPEYCEAWLGEGIIAQLGGNKKEALSHYVHGFGISDASSLIAKRTYGIAMVDRMLGRRTTSTDIASMIQPLSAIQQLRAQCPDELAYSQLAALINERVGDNDTATQMLQRVCETLESEYEESESTKTLIEFAHAKSDLGRNLLASQQYEDAEDNAQTSLDLLSEASADDGSVVDIGKIRLSCYLTVGLAQFYMGDHDAAISALSEATTLAAQHSADALADTICLLARVHWTRGTEQDQTQAKQHLEQISLNRQKHNIRPHTDSLLLSAAIALYENDDKSRAALYKNMQDLLMHDGLAQPEKEQLTKMMVRLTSAAAQRDNSPQDISEVQKAIVREPWQSIGWRELADITRNEYASQIALLTARRNVPPAGSSDAETLATAFAGTGIVDDSRTAMFLAPWAEQFRKMMEVSTA